MTSESGRLKDRCDVFPRGYLPMRCPNCDRRRLLYGVEKQGGVIYVECEKCGANSDDETLELHIRELEDQLAERDEQITSLQHDLAAYTTLPDPEQEKVDAFPAFGVEPIEVEPLRVERAREWAREHQGRRYRRPHGKVIYTVTGRTGAAAFITHSPYAVEVQRSSDNRFSPYFPADLEAMVDVT